MKRLNILWIGLISVLMTACYDDYEKDYDKSSVYFASQKPLRTLVADTDMSIKVGVAIGGKREVHTDDWATFEIDPSLLDGTGLTLMPENYYQLANPNKMTISNPNLAIADVKVTFSDAFYNDDAALDKHYAIPFRLVDHNQDEVSTDVNGQLKDYSIVVVKFVSQYHGTYFVKGKVTNLSTQQVTEYNNNDSAAGSNVADASVIATLPPASIVTLPSGLTVRFTDSLFSNVFPKPGLSTLFLPNETKSRVIF